MIGSSNQDEQDVDVSLANIVDEALLGGMLSVVGVSGWPPLFDDQPLRPEPDKDRWPGLCDNDWEFLPSWPVLASFLSRFSLARRFWNQTCFFDVTQVNVWRT